MSNHHKKMKYARKVVKNKEIKETNTWSNACEGAVKISQNEPTHKELLRPLRKNYLRKTTYNEKTHVRDFCNKRPCVIDKFYIDYPHYNNTFLRVRNPPTPSSLSILAEGQHPCRKCVALPLCSTTAYLPSENRRGPRREGIALQYSTSSSVWMSICKSSKSETWISEKGVGPCLRAGGRVTHLNMRN